MFLPFLHYYIKHATLYNRLNTWLQALESVMACSCCYQYKTFVNPTSCSTILPLQNSTKRGSSSQQNRLNIIHYICRLFNWSYTKGPKSYPRLSASATSEAVLVNKGGQESPHKGPEGSHTNPLECLEHGQKGCTVGLERGRGLFIGYIKEVLGYMYVQSHLLHVVLQEQTLEVV